MMAIDDHSQPRYPQSVRCGGRAIASRPAVRCPRMRGRYRSCRPTSTCHRSAGPGDSGHRCWRWHGSAANVRDPAFEGVCNRDIRRRQRMPPVVGWWRRGRDNGRRESSADPSALILPRACRQSDPPCSRQTTSRGAGVDPWSAEFQPPHALRRFPAARTTARRPGTSWSERLTPHVISGPRREPGGG